MANHVDNIIEVFYDKDDENAIQFLTKLYECREKDLPLSSLYDQKSYVDDRGWWENNIGAKWAYINDLDRPPEDGFFYVNITSAWSSVAPFVDHISEMLNHNCRITHQYIDEMPNFAGCKIIDKGKVTYHLDDDEVYETIEAEAKIREKAESLHFDSEEERDDWIWNWKWDFVHELVDPDKGKN